MTVYVIAQVLITDATFYDRYRAQFNEVFSHYKGTVLAADDTPAVVEGNWEQRKVVLMSFPDEAVLERRAAAHRVPPQPCRPGGGGGDSSRRCGDCNTR